MLQQHLSIRHLQCVSPNRQVNSPGHAFSGVGLAQDKPQAILLNFRQRGQRLGDVFGGGVQDRAQVFC